MKETNFKNTTIGKIPKDWKIVKLEELFNFGNGYTPSKSNSIFWHNGTIPWFRMEDIRLNGRILKDSIQHITKQAVKQNLFPAYSIILSTTATIGEHALLIADSLANQRFTFLYRKVNRESDIDIMFFYYHCFILGDWCRKNMNEGGLLAVNIDDLKNYTFTLPSLKEQRRIARVLSDMDALITSLDKLIEKKKLIKQGAMQDLLSGKKRLKGFNDSWQTIKLGEVAEIIKGQQINNDKLSDIYDFPMLNGGIEFSGYYYCYNSEAETITISEGGNCGFVNYIKEKFWCGGHCYKLLLQTNIDKLYLFYSLKHNEKKIMKLRIGSGIQNIQVQDLNDFILKLSPTIDEQEEIAKILTDMDKEIENLQDKKEKYQKIKQGMMQELLTGRIRLI